MTLGPLRFLALLAASLAMWTAGRVPVVIANARADVATVGAWRVEVARLAAYDRGLASALHRELSPVVTVKLVDLRPPGRHSSVLEGRVTQRGNPGSSQARSLQRITSLGSGLRRNDDTIRIRAYLDLDFDIRRTSLAVAHRPTPTVKTPASLTAFALATNAYASLERGDRRAAARQFDAALTAAPADPNAFAWLSELQALRKRWSGEAYSLVRGAGSPGLGALPLLGGSQSGATVAWTPDPLQRHPFAVVARATVAHDDRLHLDSRSTQAALGLRWQALPRLSLTAERLVAAGSNARDAWSVRAAGGGSHAVGPVRIEAYAEAGIVGARRGDTFASAQIEAVVPLEVRGVRIEPGIAAWSAIQATGTTVHRVDTGPTLAVHAGPLTVSASYRFRISGDAAPDSGPVLTVSATF